MRNNILIVGGNSKIGKNLHKKLKHEYNVTSTTREGDFGSLKLNLLNPDFSVLENRKFNFAFYCASITNMIECERSNEAYIINVVNTKKTIDFLNNINVKIIFLSTDLILLYDKKNYVTKSTKKNFKGYESHKYEIEQYILKNANSCVIRLPKVVTKNDPFFNKLFNKIITKSRIELFTNYMFSPISMNYCINYLHKIIEKDLKGVWHLIGEMYVSYYRFGKLLCNELGVNEDIIIPSIKKNRLLPKIPNLDSIRNINRVNYQPQKIGDVIADYINEN